MSAENAVRHSVKARAAKDLHEKIDHLAAAIQELAEELQLHRSNRLARRPITSEEVA